MRAIEFINFNFDAEPYEGWNGEGVIVHAYDGKNEIGHVIFEPTENDNTQWYAVDVEVEEPYQRQGIATKMYDIAKKAAKAAGAIIVKSHTQTDAGRGLWNDKLVWEQDVAEVVNKELWHPERMFKQRVPIGDYEFEARESIGGMGDYDADALTIIAYDPKKKNKVIGNADFVVKGRGSKRSLVSDDTYVDPKYRGEGIATMMYAYAKSLGNDIKGSNIQTPMGKKMWANWGQDAEHLKGTT